MFQFAGCANCRCCTLHLLRKVQRCKSLKKQRCEFAEVQRRKVTKVQRRRGAIATSAHFAPLKNKGTSEQVNGVSLLELLVGAKDRVSLLEGFRQISPHLPEPYWQKSSSLLNSSYTYMLNKICKTHIESRF